MLETHTRVPWEWLGLARFILAFVVTAEHISHFCKSPMLLRWVASLGAFEAVLGFLAISGLSIGHSFNKQPEGFILRRVKRIYPVYLAALLLALLLKPLAFSLPDIGLLGANLVFLNHIVLASSLVPPAWTLALEVWLYGLAPMFARLGRTQLIVLCVASFGFYLIYEAGRSLWGLPYYAGTKWGTNLPVLAFCWLGGFGMAVFPASAKVFRRLLAAFLLGHWLLPVVAVKLISLWKRHQIGMGAPFLVTDALPRLLLIGMIIGLFSTMPRLRFPNVAPGKVFRYLGDLSYPLYLVHYPILACLPRWVPGLNPWLALGVCFLASILLYHLFDSYSRRRSLGALRNSNLA